MIIVKEELLNELLLRTDESLNGHIKAQKNIPCAVLPNGISMERSELQGWAVDGELPPLVHFLSLPANMQAMCFMRILEEVLLSDCTISLVFFTTPTECKSLTIDSPSVIKLWRCAHTVNCANCTLLPCSLSVHWGRSLLWRLSYYSHVPLDVNLFWTALRINEEVWNHWGKWLYAVASVWGRSCRKQITRK